MSDRHFWGAGWSFPPTFWKGNHQLVTIKQEADIDRSIDITLKTMKGERSLHPNFGSGLQRFQFQEMNETLKGEIQEAVRWSLLYYEPRIVVNDVIVDFPDSLNGLVEINIFYTIRTTNTRHNHVFPFSLREGTDL